MTKEIVSQLLSYGMGGSKLNYDVGKQGEHFHIVTDAARIKEYNWKLITMNYTSCLNHSQFSTAII